MNHPRNTQFINSYPFCAHDERGRHRSTLNNNLNLMKNVFTERMNILIFELYTKTVDTLSKHV